MAFLKIPLETEDGDYSFNVVLDEETFLFDIKYNNRADKWLLSVYDANDVAVLEGKPLKVGFFLLEYCNSINKPAGQLFLVPLTTPAIDPTGETLGKDVILIYSEA